MRLFYKTMRHTEGFYKTVMCCPVHLKHKYMVIMEEVLQSKPYAGAIVFGMFVFFPQKRMLCIENLNIGLTKKESGLLFLFCCFANKLLPRSYALMKIWNGDTYFNGRSMDVYVSKLRKYLKYDPDVLIMNIHGKGYCMQVPCIETVDICVDAGDNRQ